MFLIETIFTIFMDIGAWNQYGPGWGDVGPLLFLDWSWKPLAELNAIRTYSLPPASFSHWRASGRHGADILRVAYLPLDTIDMAAAPDSSRMCCREEYAVLLFRSNTAFSRCRLCRYRLLFTSA